MKIRNIINLTALFLAILCLGACGSSDGSDNQGSIVINFGNAGARYTVSEEDKAEMIYTITLTSPGKADINTGATQGAQFVSVSVSEGIWDIQVKAEGNGNRITKGQGEASVAVISGKSASVDIDMKVTGTRVHNFQELIDDFKDTALPNEYSIEIVENIEADTTKYKAGPVVIDGKTITLWSGKDVMIKRKNDIDTKDTVFTVETGTLILDGTKGAITIDGNKKNVTCSRALINVEKDGTLKMYDGVTLTNNKTEHGGAVHVSGANSYFYMYGGIISINEADNGGGVYVADLPEGGTFVKNGGTIYGEDGGNYKNSDLKGAAAVYDKSKKQNYTLGETDNWPR